MPLPGGQILNIDVLDHWPMLRDEHSAHPVAMTLTRKHVVSMGQACWCA